MESVQPHRFIVQLHLPGGEKIPNNYAHQGQQTSSTQSLDGPARKKHIEINGGAGECASKEENSYGNLQDGLSAPYVAEFAPAGCYNGSSQQKGRTDPCVSRCRLKLVCYSR